MKQYLKLLPFQCKHFHIIFCNLIQPLFSRLQLQQTSSFCLSPLQLNFSTRKILSRLCKMLKELQIFSIWLFIKELWLIKTEKGGIYEWKNDQFHHWKFRFRWGQRPLMIVPSRTSFLDHVFGTRCDGAYSTWTLNWAPEKTLTKIYPNKHIPFINFCNINKLGPNLWENILGKQVARISNKSSTR